MMGGRKGVRLRHVPATLLFVFAVVLAGCSASEPQSSSESKPTSSPAARTITQAATSSGSEGTASSADERVNCEPTPPDMMGPYYEPDAPVRTSVGRGYVLSGAVLTAGSCEPIHDARIEFWLANPEGEYDDAHRATVPAGAGGRYRFESNVPVSYGGRPPHIHVRVTAPGYRELVTQHYPEDGQTEANFDLILEPL